MIRVCLVEDQTLVRQGIQTLLQLVDDIDVVAEAKDGDEALRVISAAKPDVVLLDMCLPKTKWARSFESAETIRVPSADTDPHNL
jgi:DNA-binding NarL/FixJ family response regulator